MPVDGGNGAAPPEYTLSTRVPVMEEMAQIPLSTHVSVYGGNGAAPPEHTLSTRVPLHEKRKVKQTKAFLVRPCFPISSCLGD